MSLNLEEEIRRLALIEARKLVAEGLTVKQAVAEACRGSWSYQRQWVEREMNKTMKEVFGR